MADETIPSERNPIPAPAESTEPATGEDALGDAGKQALDRMKAERNDATRQLKALQKELEQLRQAQMSETEKAISEAVARGRCSASAAFGQRLASAEFVAAAARRNAEFDATKVLDDLNLAKYVTEAGDPDVEGIAQAVERLVPAPAGSPRPIGDADLGARQTTVVPDDSPRGLISAALAATSQPRP